MIIFIELKFIHNVLVYLNHSNVKIKSPKIIFDHQKSFNKKIRLFLKLI